MELNKTNKTDHLSFLKLGETGFFPLFYQEWLESSLQKTPNMTLKKAAYNVKSTFEHLSSHATIEKKKTALIGMDSDSREEFIRSFFKVIEHQILRDLKSLH